MRLRIMVGAWFCVAAVTPVAHAQDPFPPLTGRLVNLQVCADSLSVVGTVTDQSEALITLMSYGEPRPVRISEIGRAQLRGHDRGRWATIGMFLGAVGGALGHRLVNGSDGYTGLVSLYIAAPIGALVGGTTGAILAPEEWVALYLRRCP